MSRTSFFSVALPQSHDSHWIDPNLQKGRGEDARAKYLGGAGDCSEDIFPTGKMTAADYYNQLSKSESRQIPDFTHFYNTVLTPQEEQQFGEWKTGMEASSEASLAMHDYDLKGAWKAGVKPRGNFHWDDSFKKPNNPTFSNDSIYAEQQKPKNYVPTDSEPMGRPAGGVWIAHNGDKKHYTFVPSAHVMTVRTPAQMLAHFNAHEKDHNVVLGNEVHVGSQGKGMKDNGALTVVEREAPLRNSLYYDMPLHEFYNQLSKSYKTPAWQRAEGQNPKGGLNAKGRESAKREGHNLKPPVKSGDNPRRASFLARMGGSPGPEYDEHGEPTRLLLALRVWGASSKADAKKKAAAMSERLKKKNLAKSRGEDAKLAHLSSRYAASGLSERDFPTGQMMGITRSGIRHLGVFGEKRHIRVEASEPERGDTTHINWVHVMPGTKVEPHHVTQIFEALHAAGYEKPLRWNAMRDDDEKYSLRPARRDRLFRPLAAQWDEFVASKQAGSKPPKES